MGLIGGLSKQKPLTAFTNMATQVRGHTWLLANTVQALLTVYSAQINRAQDVLWRWVSASTHMCAAATPAPKKHLLSFHLNTEHTSLALCKDEGWNTKDVYRWCQQSPSSPSCSFKNSKGLRHRGSWVFPSPPPLFSSCLFFVRQVPGDRLCNFSKELIRL